MKYIVFSILFAFLGSGVALAQERGIGVSPAEINISQNVDWPYTVPITVTNYSENQEQFQVLDAQANPARFSLDARQSRRVLVTFEKPAQGVIKVLSMHAAESGLSTGTGVKIPFLVQGVDNSRFLASANQSAGGFPYIFGAGILLASLLLLWQIAGIIGPWVTNSNKQ